MKNLTTEHTESTERNLKDYSPNVLLQYFHIKIPLGALGVLGGLFFTDLRMQQRL